MTRTRSSILATLALIAGLLVAVPPAHAAVGGTIDGSITDFDTALPFSTGYVYIVDAFDTTTFDRYRHIVNDPSLPYSLTGIPAGTYRLRARVFGPGPTDIIEGYQWYTGGPPGATTFEGGTDLVVTDGGSITADFAIDEIVGAGMDGTITNAVTTLPVEECHSVMAWEATSGIGVGVVAGATDPTGTYAFGNLPNGDYVVSIWENYGSTPPCDHVSPVFYDEWFGGSLGTDFFVGQGLSKLDNPPLIGTASPVTISGSDVTVDFALTPIPGIGGTVTGSITDFDTASPFPAPHIHFVDLFDTTTLDRYREIIYDPSLPYTFTGVPAGTYHLRARVFGGASIDIMEGYQWWTGAPPGATVFEGGADVVVTDGGLVTANFAIDEIVGAGIGGVITDEVTTLPIEECHSVSAWEADSGIGIGIFGGATDPTGTYAFGNLPNGDYLVSIWESYGFDPPCDGSSPDYFDEWFGGALGTDFFVGIGEHKLDNPPLIETASPVTISGSDLTVDFALTPFGVISGTVTDGTGTPFTADYTYAVDVFDTTSLYRTVVFGTETDGSYTISGLPPGTYRLRGRVFEGSDSIDFLKGYGWWTGAAPSAPATTFEGGTDIVVGGGSITADLRLGAITGGPITGTVTDVLTSAPVFGACYAVHAFEATSGIGIGYLAPVADATGYAVGTLPSGDYKVGIAEFYGGTAPCDASAPGYFDRWFGGDDTTMLFAGVGGSSLDNPPLIGTGTVVTVTAGPTTADLALTPYCPTDFDGDGIVDCLDPDDDNDGQTDADEVACGSDPLDAASLSSDFDSDGIPDCVDPDDDNDGIPDTSDAVPMSDTSSMVEIDGIATGVANQTLPDGSTMADQIAEAAATATSHGQFARAVSKLANGWKKAGLITGREKGTITSAAARSSLP